MKTYSEIKGQKIRLNQVGFMKNAAKKFVFCGESEDFSVKIMKDGMLIEVYSGKLTPIHDNSLENGCFVGDFSDVCEEGVYKICCGEYTSRTFAIYDNVYDAVCRMMTYFFTWQRCGDRGSWAGLCHLGERIITKNGEEKPLIGGHHQSCDLRKWTYGTTLGIYGLADYLNLAKPIWNKGEIEYDLYHAAKYYLSLISDEGYVYDSTFVPEDYNEEKCRGVGMGDYNAFFKNRRYFDSPTTPIGHYNLIRALSAIALSLKNDAEFAAKCMAGEPKRFTAIW